MFLKSLKMLVVMSFGAVVLAACGKMTDDQVKLGIIQYAEHPALDAAREGFLEALQEAGYTEGDNLKVTLQNAQADQSNLQTMVEKLAGQNDLHLAIATPAAQSLLTVDDSTPALFTAVTDPVAAGLVKSLEQPGGNMTGSTDALDVAKQVELLTKLFPTAKKIGIFYNSSEVNSESQAKVAKKALEQQGLEIIEKTVTSTNDVQQVMSQLATQVDAIYLPTDNTVASTIATIGDVLREAKVPALGSDEAVLEGVLLTSGVDFKAVGKQAGELAVQILKGEKPSELSVKSPDATSIAVNEDMAKLLGLNPETIKQIGKEK
ncbi:ABC transporter substrate-binding protein [Streptococcus entericus]|uniref:ABC transporter substrate-binding protein n=1 Tax=Streptococcus entericus TaxID=155680 RepID=UPI000367C9C1